ncbi:MAG: hypothetical protein A2020_12940 [Lentisphaerae bacterium GWF2_45_14]|nr:MAG: hypothetical protein A2020_12940 [Lentisphaerae bacterium GWF2_45_14]
MLLIVPLVLVALSIVLLVCLTVQRSNLIEMEKERDKLLNTVAEERKAASDIINISGDIIEKNQGSNEFLARYLEYVVKLFGANGGALLEKDKNGFFTGCSVIGSFPVLKEVSEELEYELVINPQKHTESLKGWTSKFSDTDIEELCGEKDFAIFFNQCPIWFPARFLQQAPEILIAPLKIKNRMNACVIITSDNSSGHARIREHEADILVRLNKIAAGIIEFFRVFEERQEREAYLLADQGESMMQLSSGMMHNIGNALTIAKLSVQELCDRLSLKEKERPETLILEEMIPVLKNKLADGSLQDFLKNDPIGKDYLGIISELLLHLRLTGENSAKQLQALSAKLSHIKGIIELQQHFSNELGSEGPANLSGVINAALNIFESAFNKYSIKVKRYLDERLPDVPADPSMMIQILINIMKNSAEAIASEQQTGKDYFIEVCLYSENGQDEKKGVAVEIKDNGPGIAPNIKKRIFEFGFSTKVTNGTRGRGLHSCMNILKRYNGSISVESAPGKGTAVKVFLPFQTEKEPF